MSEPLRDVRSKISGAAWSMLEAESRATGRLQAEILRDVIHEWADSKQRFVNTANKLLAATGNTKDGSR
jgi:hypothetical protein